MAIELDMGSPDFERALRGAARRKARIRGRRRRRGRPRSSRTYAPAATRRSPNSRCGSTGSNLRAIGLEVGAAEIDAAVAACEPKALEALELAHARVTAYHQRQKPADLSFTDELGVELGWRWRPIAAVGLYVPGGAASYPSSVVMNAVPAKVAGCRAAGDGRADAGRAHQPAGAGGGANRRNRRDLPGRRRAGDRRARLWNGNDRRPWQRSSVRATPMSRPRSGAYSASSAST